jgi:hypothetical protein
MNLPVFSPFLFPLGSVNQACSRVDSWDIRGQTKQNKNVKTCPDKVNLESFSHYSLGFPSISLISTSHSGKSLLKIPLQPDLIYVVASRVYFLLQLF